MGWIADKEIDRYMDRSVNAWSDQWMDRCLSNMRGTWPQLTQHQSDSRPQNRLVLNDVVFVSLFKHANFKRTKHLATTDIDTYVYTTYRPTYLDCRLDCTGFDPCRGEIFLSSPQLSDLLCHTRSIFPGGGGGEPSKVEWGLRMSGAVPLLPLYTCVAWTGTTLRLTEKQRLLQSGYRKADHAVSDLAYAVANKYLFPAAQESCSDLGDLNVDVSRSHTVKHTTISRTLLDDGSGRRRDL
jgi:hypothetical protein